MGRHLLGYHGLWLVGLVLEEGPSEISNFAFRVHWLVLKELSRARCGFSSSFPPPPNHGKWGIFFKKRFQETPSSVTDCAQPW